MVLEALRPNRDRFGDAHASLRSLNRAGDALRKGMPLVVFPEGGRSRTGELQEFMGGAFYVAIRAQAPVVPTAIVGTYDLLPMNSFHMIPGDVDLVIGEPIPDRRLAFARYGETGGAGAPGHRRAVRFSRETHARCTGE